MSPVRQAPVTLVRRRQHPCFPLSFPIPAHVEGRRPVRWWLRPPPVYSPHAGGPRLCLHGPGVVSIPM